MRPRAATGFSRAYPFRHLPPPTASISLQQINFILTGIGWSAKAKEVLNRMLEEVKAHSQKIEVHIETLNNMGVINSFTQNNGIGTPVRMPYPESWKKTAKEDNEDSAPRKSIHLKSGGGRKIKMLRVLVAMYEAGFFVDDAGPPVDQQDVFAAFADILGVACHGPTAISVTAFTGTTSISACRSSMT